MSEDRNIVYIKAIFVFIFGTGSYFFQAFAFENLWNWFAVPLGAHKMNYIIALGISMMFAVMNYKSSSTPDRSMNEVSQSIVNSYFTYSFALLFGSVLKGFL
jgi:hypothetical protein